MSMSKQSFETPLRQGNQCFQKNEILKAIYWYELAAVRHPDLRPYTGFNLQLAYRRLGQDVAALTPIYDLEATSTPAQWISKGQDPFFLFTNTSAFHLKQGWFEAQFVIESPTKNSTARIYLDYGNDFSEENTVCIPYQSGRLVTKVFKTDKPVVQLRFDPLETTGQFRIKAFEVNAISEDTAKQHMLCRLLQEESLLHRSADDLLQSVGEAATKNKASLIQALTQYYESLYQTNSKPSYSEWIHKVETPSLPSKAEMQKHIAAMPQKPLISIIMPVYNTPVQYLKACINSVLAQTYPHWELCIADDNSPQPHVRQLLSQYQRLDSRIKVIYRPKNGHISKASNSALKLATGQYIALLDHDDFLPAHALYYVADTINQKPESQIIYSDEDKIDEKGIRFEPHFKSDWNPDLFYSQNYVSHLGVYRHDIIQKIKGFRVGVEGAQDQDLLLRCLPHTKPKNIVHIPKVLYHWRALKGSTALDSGEKSYTTQAGVKALRDYFDTIGRPDVKVGEGQIPNTYRVQWPIPTPQPLVSLLIPTRDKKQITELAVSSILNKTTYSNFEIIIIDNGSVEPETLAWFKDIQQDARVRVLRYDKPFNYSAINNFGAQHAKGSVLGLVNNDVEVISPEWLSEMVSHAIRPDIGCVGAKLYYGNGTIQHGGVIIGLGGVAGHSHKHFPKDYSGYFHRLKVIQNYSAVTAACLIVKKSLFESIKGLDEENLSIAFNDVNFCLESKSLGYRNLWTPYAELYHHESISRGAEDSPEKIKRFNKEINFMKMKWQTNLICDQFYNRNLTKAREDFSLGNLV